ncbi:membralin-like isoform X2 [Argiope bruennichi]|uniref:membralin-like isoform X2 n=1 Tax=Argiope bruennichi TaxID=94029 RepID=UPI002493E022|nr:membralin-like isoform X2 [Argiope bruennichi]
MPRHLFQVTVNLPGSFRNNINNNDIFNPYVFVRNRLYHFLFHRFALGYARVFSEFHRQLMEFFILLAALFSFILLVYVHVVFVQSPITCLENYRDVFKRADILRVEVLSGKGKQNYTLLDSYFKEKAIRLQYFESQGRFIYTEHLKREEPEEFYPFDEDEEIGFNESISDPDAFKAFTLNSETLRADTIIDTLNTDDIQESQHLEPELEVSVEEESYQTLSEASILATDPNNAYIMEFSLEYGYLRLRPAKRHDLNITVVFVILDPEEDACFGGPFNIFLLDNFLGYDHFLLQSIKQMAEKKSTKELVNIYYVTIQSLKVSGFVRNAVMEIEYIFINNWVNDRSFFTAGFVMIVFTLTISALLRHSHHQIFVVVANIFDAVWPRNFIPTSGAPVLTVILALVGMEAVMSDFFHDRTIALHIIVVVWFADIYDAVCCQSPLSKRHWYKFFYLYHFLFYAYNYKFLGVYWRLSLTVSWLFIFHSMIFFFHHYELPRFLHRAAMFQATRNANNRRSSRSHNRRNHSSPNNNNNNNNNQELTNESTPLSDRPEVSSDNQPNGSEINQPDQQQPAENLVNEEVVSAAGYDSLSQSEANTESKNSEMKCCDVCHSLQNHSEVHTCLKENPTTAVSTAEENSVESNDENAECHHKDDEVESFENFSGHQTCEHSENEFSDGRNAEKFAVEGIFNESNIDEKAEKPENVVHSRELNVD